MIVCIIIIGVSFMMIMDSHIISGINTNTVGILKVSHKRGIMEDERSNILFHVLACTSFEMLMALYLPNV